ncbi:MAG: hypothetical protein QM778_19015 [Myxococcales bacterium]
MASYEAKPLVLVLDERAAESGRAFEDLESSFTIKRIVSVIGCNAQEQTLAGVVLHLSASETRTLTLLKLLRGQRGVDATPIFLLCQAPIEPLTQAVQSVPGVEVLDVARAHLQLRARILTAASSTGRRLSQPDVQPAAAGTPHERLQRRFLVHSAERGQRALALCDELKTNHLPPSRRAALLDEVKDLLNMMKGEATMLRLRSVAEVLTTAETIVSRIDQTPAKVVMPMGVLDLFSDLASLNASGANIGSFDADMHRSRLLEN